MRLKGLTCITPINLWLLKIFSKGIFNVDFSPRSSVFEAHFQEPSTLWKVKIAMGPLALNLKWINHNYSFSISNF